MPFPGEPDPQRLVAPMERMHAIALALLEALAERQEEQRVLLAALNTLPATSDAALRISFDA